MEKRFSRRALRRHHLARLKARRYRYHANLVASLDPLDRPVALGRIVATPKSCSCWMCGNPRRYQEARTLQEIQADQMLTNSLVEWHATLGE